MEDENLKFIHNRRWSENWKTFQDFPIFFGFLLFYLSLSFIKLTVFWASPINVVWKFSVIDTQIRDRNILNYQFPATSGKQSGARSSRRWREYTNIVFICHWVFFSPLIQFLLQIHLFSSFMTCANKFIVYSELLKTTHHLKRFFSLCSVSFLDIPYFLYYWLFRELLY